MKKSYLGPGLIMLAASLWALDALLRTHLTETIPSIWIVLIEHIFGSILLMPFLIKGIKSYKKLRTKEIIIALVLALVSGLAGTVLFTEAMAISSRSFDYSSPVLLQKLQPLFVVFLSIIFLKEKLNVRLLLAIPIALIGSYMVSFGTQLVDIASADFQVYLFSIGAALAWGSGTILSKYLLARLSFGELTALRFILTIPFAILYILISGQGLYSIVGENIGLFSVLTIDALLSFVIIALSTGAAAIVIYYKGLQLTKASVATFAELTFPIIYVLIAITPLNPNGDPQILSLANSFGIIVLLSSIVLISLEVQHEENI